MVGSLIALWREEGEGCIITAVNIIFFFDKHSLSDAMQTLHKAKVNKTLFKVCYKLNEKTTIQVMTGAGLTARGLAGLQGRAGQACRASDGPGRRGGPLASALNLNRGVEDYFSGSKDEECYGRVKLQPLFFRG